MQRWVWLGLVVCFGGCDDGDGSAAPLASPADYVSAAAEITCEYMFRCQPGGNEFVSTEPECRAVFGGLLGASTGGFDNGWAEFDGQAAGDCIANARSIFAGAMCGGEEPEGLGDCEAVAIPRQGEMDPCGEAMDDTILEFPYVCMNDLICASSDDGVPVCQQPIALGEPCQRGTELCGDAAYCKQGEEGAVCTALTPIGGACTDWEECGEDGDCSEDGVCEPW